MILAKEIISVQNKTPLKNAEFVHLLKMKLFIFFIFSSSKNLFWHFKLIFNKEHNMTYNKFHWLKKVD